MTDIATIQRFAQAQAGVFSKADLQGLLGEPHPAAFVRRVTKLIESGSLVRFCRGWYVTKDFELATLSQRIAPDSYISFGTVLAAQGVLGTETGSKVVAVKSGPARKYKSGRYRIEHVTLNESLFFGFATQGETKFADAEKALLDTFYFHLRGRKYAFDIYSDLDWSRLDLEKLSDYLQRYKNPKFVAFVQGLIKEL